MALQSLKNKKIVISAGASGIGLATAKVCLDRGATVFVCDIDEKLINKLRKNIKNKKYLFIIAMHLMKMMLMIYLIKLKKHQD